LKSETGGRELCLLRASEYCCLFCRVWLGLCVLVTGGLLWTEQLASGDHWKDIEILRPMFWHDMNGNKGAYLAVKVRAVHLSSQ
jgi:hypothetical protein